MFSVGKAKRSLIDFHLIYDLLQNIPEQKYNLIPIEDLNKDMTLLSSILKNTEERIINDDCRDNFLSIKENLKKKYQTLINV